MADARCRRKPSRTVAAHGAPQHAQRIDGVPGVLVRGAGFTAEAPVACTTIRETLKKIRLKT